MESGAADAGGGGGGDGVERLWQLAATAVWLEHLCLLDGEPFRFAPARLSWWAASFLEAALPAILAELAHHRVSMRRVQSDGEYASYQLTRLLPDGRADLHTAGEVRDLLVQVCAPMIDIELDWLSSLRTTVEDIGEVLCEVMGERLDLSQVRATEVSHAVMFNEEWSVPYEVSWQADGAGKCITMPDVPNFAKRHFDHFADRMGHVNPGHTILYQFLGTFVIPCHEVIHIAQHVHGGLIDSDPWSYAMEHDASRLNFVLLWLVLQRRKMDFGWAKWVVMMDGLNRSLSAWKRFQEEKFHPAYTAYRQWAESFGVDSPGKAFADAGDAEALQLEALSKCLVAGEALAVGGPVAEPPTWEHLVELVVIALDPERRGDVYSDANRSRVAAGIAARSGDDRQTLQLDAAAPDRLFAAAAPECTVAARLRVALQSACGGEPSVEPA